ncbi:aminotransferase-like domain-containing protein [Jannaschia rubra]|uniref:Putative HTH-type transcriptional regulator YjiR n=1 Tax=Jannaschia rubra TaxID=282197 RepID=A0A0M6XT41_9RHOB|nr:PLP-dependent aminotransferase family protein [Jannaschia rubra]CTQ34319.1 putative HTH-type transcriptional regulator YjiR [Jannaschia rubra]SFG17998.1 DNA-binding transcriptional regulator, MocR family, contains an aminotransferase domain [Jannaschia rubra]
MGTITDRNVIEVDFGSDPRPKYLVLESAVRTAVTRGDLPPGTRLPPVRDLAWKVGVTPGTVARVYRALTDAGLLEATVGRGTFVANGRKPVGGLAEVEVQGTVNMRVSQVMDVGQADRIADAMAAMGPSPDGYGSYPVRDSDLDLRRALSGWLTETDCQPIAADDMVLTLGAQHATVVLFHALLHGPRPVVLTEDLCYPGFRHAAALVRADLRGVPFDEEGLLPDALERIAAQTGAQILATSAEAHNPTTNRTSPARRAEIVSICERYNLEIIDDDCFACVPTAPTYRDLAPNRTWVTTSLSKTISPALRMGMIGPARGRADLAVTAMQQQVYGLPRPQIDLVRTLIETGVAASIREDVMRLQAARVIAARRALAGYDLIAREDVPFAWLRLPRGWRASSFLRAAEAEGVMLKAADEFALVDGQAPNAVRLALNGTLSDDRFEGALATLTRLLASPPQEIDT